MVWPGTSLVSLQWFHLVKTSYSNFTMQRKIDLFWLEISCSNANTDVTERIFRVPDLNLNGLGKRLRALTRHPRHVQVLFTILLQRWHSLPKVLCAQLSSSQLDLVAFPSKKDRASFRITGHFLWNQNVIHSIYCIKRTLLKLTPTESINQIYPHLTHVLEENVWNIF